MGKNERMIDRAIRFLMMKKDIDFTAAQNQYKEMSREERVNLIAKADKAFKSQPF